MKTRQGQIVTRGKPGMLSCLIENPEGGTVGDFHKPAHVWVNIWTSRNLQGSPVGISYCDLIYCRKPESKQAEPDHQAAAEDDE